MSDIKKVRIQDVLDSQIPEYLREDSPLFKVFLSEYYNSLTHKSGAIDLSKNIKEYKDIDAFSKENLIPYTILTQDVLVFDDVINVASTLGWPEKYGLLKIDDEIITYHEKTETSFVGCVRGFSGIDQIKSTEKSEFLQFTSTAASEHTASSTTLVHNLSNLFLREFFEKYKSEFLPGFESRQFVDGISIQNILSRSKDFYTAKGTDSSYKILFKILYGKEIEIIKPQDFTIIPSANSYFTTKNILVEKISGGEPTQIKGNFLYQDLGNIGTVSASIFNVEYRPLSLTGKSLYEISLDSTSFNGNFQVTGKTKILETVPAGSDTILVDSTIGFSKSGIILVKPQNSNFIEINYTDTTSNQFLGVTGVTKELDYGLDVVEEKFAYSYIGLGNTSIVQFRIVNVIDNVDFSKTSNLRIGDKVKLSGFGRDLTTRFEFNNWIYNIPTNHEVKTVSQQDANKFRLFLYDSVSFYKNEIISLQDNFGKLTKAKVISVEYEVGDIVKKYSNRILVQILDTNADVLNTVLVKKIIYKSNHYSNYFSNLSSTPSGVQNTYISSDEENFYVSSTGLPNYPIFVTDTKKSASTSIGSTTTNLVYAPNHNFITGESIYYEVKSEDTNISSGTYFITKVDENYFSLSYSKTDVYSKKYIQLNHNISGDFVYKIGYQGKTLKNQKLFKKFNLSKKPYIFDDKNKRSTNNREIGLLVNGVEILSPTLFDENVYYGKLTSIEVTNPGKDYDVINVAPIEVKDDTGVGAKAHLNLIGEVKEVKVITPGIGYQTKPKITIIGGNGTGCVLESNLVKSRISVGFKPEVSVSIANNTITFLNNHNFNDGEEVVYYSNKNLDIAGLVDRSHYYVGIIDEKVIKLYNKESDAFNKSNAIDITGISSGFHNLETLKSKNTITKVYVKDPGRGYSNRSVTFPSELSFKDTVGINTYDSYIYAPNHGFKDGELVDYSSTDTVISGMSSESHYYVKVLDTNKFKLSYAGVGTNLSRDNFINKRYIQFKSLGVGTHTVAYPPIQILVESLSAIGSTSIVQPLLEPIVLGRVSDVYLENGGVGYGCTNIINFHRRPNVGLSSITSECLLKPIIVDGTINDVKIINRGKGYRKDSDIIISGEGNYAELKPIISDGKVIGVDIVRGGVGYASSNTVLSIVNRGVDAKFLANVYEWKINQVVKSKNIISDDDDGITYPSKNPNLELQFVHFYTPKKLRYQLDDNFTETNKEIQGSKSHSPILGFAYDGYPIYGPYGYDPLVGGSIRQIRTGYALQVNNQSGVRPSGFEPGFFVNDYVFTGTGDLDENNGRWCITPQYPNGTYAYFISINVDSTGKSTPTYPYTVGSYFKGTPIEENFLPKFNQDLDLSTFNITRNIGPYYLTYNNSYYDLIDKVSENYKQEFRVSDIQFSGITSTSIFAAGTDYQVNDRLIINNKNTFGSSANIVVSRVEGNNVSQFSVVEDKISNVDFYIRGNNIVCTTSSPHDLKNNESIVISGISTISSASLEGIHKISVVQKSVELLKNIPSLITTGVSTFISVKDVSGFNSNDVIGIGTEILRITNVSSEKSGFYVNRISNTGVHTAGVSSVILLPTTFQFSIKEPNPDSTIQNYVTFFDPKETVGTGTQGITRSIVGIGTSILNNRFIPSRSIYIPSHRFYTGQPLVYDCGIGGTSLYVNNVGSGVSFILNKNSIVYAVNLGTDYIGLSTIGFTSTSGIGTTLNSLEFVNFDSSFSIVGSSHSLTTLNPKIVGTIERFTGIVTTSDYHYLGDGDEIDLTIENNQVKTVKLLYNPEIRKLTTDKIQFSNTDVSPSNDTITLTNSDIKTGDKVVYTSSSPIGGLENNGIYFVIKYDINKIKLCQYQSEIGKSEINFTSSGGSSHAISLINPPLTFIKGDIAKFDLSDSTVADMDLQFYEDPSYQQKVELVGNSEDGFVVYRSGIPGTEDAYVSLDTKNKYFPSLLFYNLIPKSPIDERKYQITSDFEVSGNNKISLQNHLLNDKFNISISDENTFVFNLKKKPTDIEKLSYNSSNISYTTDSETAYGPISKLKINFPGRGYKKLPFVESIVTEKGRSAVIKLISPNIGKVESYERVKDGFDYPTDPTLTPTLSVPTVIGIKDIRTIDYVGILTGGRRYNNPPTLFVKDHPYIQLQSEIIGGSVSKVNILNNVTDLKKPLEIFSIYNSNGYDIDNIVVNGNLITLELLNSPTSYPLLTVGFGKTDINFPFKIGDKIFIEGCRLTRQTSSKANFNSSNYDYKFFNVVGVNTVNNTVTYNMSGISTSQFGTYNGDLTLGYVVNKNDMPVFEMILKDDVEYLSGERVTSNNFNANVMENGWDNDLNQMRVNNSFGELKIGDKIYGESSKVNGTVEYYDTFNLRSTLGVSRDKVGVIDNSVGILDDFQQRISDNFYYQKFSYSIKSEIPYDIWRESVRSIIHPSGFKEFSDLEIYTEPTDVGTYKSTNLKPKVLDNASSFLVNLDNEVSIYKRDNFATVYEEDFLDNGSVERVYFSEGRALRNYIVNKTNKVIKIDDISNQFNGTSTQSLVGRFADASDLLDANRAFIQEEVVGFITATYPGITTNPDWDRSICYRDVGYIVDAISHDVKYGSNNKSIEAGLAYWSGLGTSYVAGESTETIGGFKYIINLSKYIINNVGVQTSYQLGSSVNISTAVYNNVTGITTITTTAPHGLSTTTTNYVVLKNLVFSCNSGGGLNTAIFPNTGNGPDGNGPLSPKGFVYQVEVIDGIRFRVNPGPSTITHNYVSGGTIQKAFISTTQYIDPRILFDVNCSDSYNENCCADVWTTIGNYVGIITTIIGIGTTAAPTNIIYPSTAKGGQVVGLSTFKLKNKGVPLFKREFDASSESVVNLTENCFVLPNHNFQTGQELIYDYGSGTPIGIATTSQSYSTSVKDVVALATTYFGTAIYENGYGQPVSGPFGGNPPSITPGPPSILFTDVVGIATTSIGTGALFDVLVTYGTTTGNPLSYSISLKFGGSGFSVGNKVSISGTYFGGTDPTNNLSFNVTRTAPTGIQTQANRTYLNVPSTSTIGTGARFNVNRDNNGRVSLVSVENGGTGYALTSIISIAGTYVGGSSTKDIITFSPSELYTNRLPQILYVYKLDDSKFRVSGLSSSVFLDLTQFGVGIHSLSYSTPNPSTLITIDGVIQTALRRKSLSVSLASSVSTATTTILNISSGISSLNTYDVINIDSEYLLIKSIGVSSSNAVEVVRGSFGTKSGVHTIGSSHQVLNGDFNVIGDVIYFKTPPYGKIGPTGLQTGSIFGGRVFSRKFDSSVPKDKNVLLDDISLSFTGIAATEFTLKVNGQSTTSIFNDVNNSTEINNNPIILINNVPQTVKLDFDVDGSSENVIRFLSGTPSAGKITKVAITTGFGYQPLLPAAGSATVSAAGTISRVTVIGPGSGYRQPPVVTIASTVGTGASVIATVGTGGTITSFTVVNPGTGYTTSSPPTIVVGFPTGYSYLGVAYTGGSSGVGQGAKVSVVVGQGSSIISFKIDNPGIGYKVGDILSVPGITTNPGLSTVFSPFRLTVQEVQTDKFSGFYPGQFIIFDDISSTFNGFRKKFTLSVTKNGVKEVLSLRIPQGTDLDLSSNLLVYINDILQIPGDSYTFFGSRISFKEAPKSNSKCLILYYRGSSIDVEEVEPPKTIKEGDTIFIKENKNDLLDTDQLDRVVKKIVSSDQLDTFTYSSVGILTDPTKLRPLTWVKQTQDRIISGSLYSKSRPNLKSNVSPNARVIKKIEKTDTTIYVDNAFPLFTEIDKIGEDLLDVLITETKEPSPALCTSIVSSSSSISSIVLNNGGVGYAYTQNPVVTISKSFIKKKDPIKDWQYSSGISSSYDLQSVTKGNIFVSVGNSSVLAFSERGSQWNTGIVGFGGTISFNSVSCGGTNIFCAVGNYAVVVKSVGYANTISSWTTCSLVEEQIIPGLGVVSKVGTSYTGVLLDVAYSPYIDTWTAVGAGGSIFGASGIGSTAFTSRFSSTLQDINSVVAGPSRIIAVGGNGTILSSINNQVWETLNSPTLQNLTKVIYANGQFVAVGTNGTVIRSSGNGAVFETLSTNLLEDIVDIHYTDFYTILTITGKLYYSFDLSNWVYRDTNQYNLLKQLIFAPEVGLEGRYVGVGFGGTAIYADPIYNRAVAVSSVSAGIVTNISILNGGFGYSPNDIPPVLIEPERSKTEKIRSIKVKGDFGTIIGINTFVPGTPGIGTTSPKLEFVLKSETYDNSTLGIGYSSLNTFGVSYSNLSKGDYFVITNSNVTVGHALTGITTSLGGMSNYPNSRVGTAYTYLDGVYRVEQVTIPSAGIVTVTCNFAPIEGSFGNYILVYLRGSSGTGINTNNFYGRYSWSKIYDYQNRVLDSPETFDVYNNNGISGISTNPQIMRTRGV